MVTMVTMVTRCTGSLTQLPVVEMSWGKKSKKKPSVLTNFHFLINFIRHTGSMVTRCTGRLSQLLVVKMSWGKQDQIGLCCQKQYCQITWHPCQNTFRTSQHCCNTSMSNVPTLMSNVSTLISNVQSLNSNVLFPDSWISWQFYLYWSTGDRACQNNRALVSLPVSENVVAMVTLLSYYKKLDVCLPLIVSMSDLSPCNFPPICLLQIPGTDKRK